MKALNQERTAGRLPAKEELLTNGLVAIDQHHRKITTNSLQVAAYFGKRASDVNRKVDHLNRIGLCKIAPSYYLNKQNKRQKFFPLNRDEFLQLALGFTGRKAEQFRRDFIQFFNEQEAELEEWEADRIQAAEWTNQANDSIFQLQTRLKSELPDSKKGAFIFTHIQQAINKAVTGKASPNRDEMSIEQLQAITGLEVEVRDAIEGYFEQGELTACDIRVRILERLKSLFASEMVLSKLGHHRGGTEKGDEREY